MDKKEESKTRPKRGFFLLLLFLLFPLFLITYTQLTIFTIPPIGAVPEGKTLIISRLNKTNFIDSPDAMCKRIQGGVNLLCRGMVLGAIGEKATIYLRLPYSETLYLVSTNGQKYSK
ncbi:MAG: hypothetical protein ACNS63_01075 [Candidatus Nitrospinota bacterium M3_3B_026]